jgi:hypothetical protein
VEAEPAVFRADHPFVFLIRDDRTDTTLAKPQLSSRMRPHLTECKMKAMPFIVKATDKATGIVAWVAPVDTRGLHTLATRQMAEIFPSVEDAQTAINETQQTFFTEDVVFVIESEH